MAKAKTGDVTTVPALVVKPSKAPVVGGNFEDIERYLEGWRQKVSSMKMTEDNMEEVRVIKKEAVQYRNSLKKIQSDIKKLYFNDPKAVFDAKMGTLFAVIDAVEKDADDVLAKEEEERVAGINEVLDSYKAKFQAQFNLDDGHLARIEYTKQFYNKTVPQGFSSTDKFWKNGLEQQFLLLKKEQDAYAANIRLIKTNCKEDPRLNEQHYIDRLRYADVASIVEAIIAEKRRLRELDAQPARTGENSGAGDAGCEPVDDGNAGCVPFDDEDEECDAEGQPPLVIGVTDGIDFVSDFRGRKKSLKVEITYPCDLGDALTEVFRRLAQNGITSKVLPEKETVF